MTGPDAVRPPWSWLAAVVGFGLQTVVRIGDVVATVATPGGRRSAGLIVGLVLQVPLSFPTVGALENGGGVAESVMVVGTVLVVAAICVPATWRWARRPAPRELAAPPPWPA